MTKHICFQPHSLMAIFFSIWIIIRKAEKYFSTVKALLHHLVLEQVMWLFCLHHLGRWSTPAYASTGVPAHLFSVWSRKSKVNSYIKSTPGLVSQHKNTNFKICIFYFPKYSYMSQMIAVLFNKKCWSMRI